MDMSEGQRREKRGWTQRSVDRIEREHCRLCHRIVLIKRYCEDSVVDRAMSVAWLAASEVSDEECVESGSRFT